MTEKNPNFNPTNYITGPLQSPEHAYVRPVWADEFIRVLRTTGIVISAIRATGVSRRLAYAARDIDVEFAMQWQDAVLEAAEAMEEEARRRAVDGWEEPVFGRLAREAGMPDPGEGRIGEIRKHSDVLMSLMLKGNLPGKYNPTQETAVSGAIKIQYVNDWRATPESEE